MRFTGHLSHHPYVAEFSGRLYLHLDNNFYFGAAGLNHFPFSLFFIPYYGFAIICVFGHLASVHSNKTKKDIIGLSPVQQAKTILLLGIGFTIIIFYGLSNHFKGVSIPKEYNVLIGK